MILAASRSDGLRRTAERMPVTREVVHRFVPGETVADAMDSVAQLRDSGRLCRIDYLGEDVTDIEPPNATVGPTWSCSTRSASATSRRRRCGRWRCR